MRSIRQEVKEDRKNLKIAVVGDVQRIKNILQKNKELQRLYQKMPVHKIVENIDQRTFIKRKELDRLIDKKNKLTRRYENELV